MINKYLHRLVPVFIMIIATFFTSSIFAQELESNNFTISDDELMVGSLNSESANFSIIGEDSPLVGSLESDNFSQEGVVLGERVPSPSVTTRTCNESCATDSNCDGSLVCYGGRCRSLEDLDSTSCPVTSTSTATPTPTPRPIARFLQQLLEEVLPGQLFDISLEIDNNTISNIKDLIARVIFTSFGTQATPVDMTFTILNDSKEEVYRSQNSTVVQTELVFPKYFSDIDATFEDGKYTLVLKTLYNIDVEDEFRAEFTIGESPNIGWKFYLVAMLFIIIFLFIFSKKRNQRNVKKEK